jgi:hypothetical protein
MTGPSEMEGFEEDGNNIRTRVTTFNKGQG